MSLIVVYKGRKLGNVLFRSTGETHTRNTNGPLIYLVGIQGYV